MNFSIALESLVSGAKIYRDGWNGKGMYLELQRPDANSKMTLPYIYMKTACNNFVPWLASQTDLLSNDWCAEPIALTVDEIPLNRNENENENENDK